MKPLIICAAVTGGAPAKSRTPYHPVTPDEVVESAVACWRAGAAMVHIHARLPDGTTTTDVGAYQEIVDRIVAQGCDAILNLSAGDNGGRATHEQRLRVADVEVEMVSLDAGSFNIGNRIYDNSPGYLRAMAQKMRDREIAPEIEIFDIGHMHLINEFAKEGLLREPAFVQFVFGPPGAMPPDPRLLPYLIEQLPPRAEWQISAQTADHQKHLALQMAAFTMGGHVRTGMEDYFYLRPGELAKTNSEMVEQWAATARLWGRPIATPAVARELLGIRPGRIAATASAR